MKLKDGSAIADSVIVVTPVTGCGPTDVLVTLDKIIADQNAPAVPPAR